MYIPAHDKNKSSSIFTAKNFAILSMFVAFVYLTIILVQVCAKDKNDRDSELSEEFISKDYSCSYEYYYDEEYTNS